MGFDAFTKEQLKNALLAASLAISQDSRQIDPAAEEFRAGFLSALAVIATSFGIDYHYPKAENPRAYRWSEEARMIRHSFEKR